MSGSKLTGKCREDFDNHVYENMYQINENSGDMILNAIIIEFLDEKEIYIDIEVIKDKSSGYVRGFESGVIFTMHGDLMANNSDCLKEDIYESRLEATNQAIIKANEIYNHIL